MELKWKYLDELYREKYFDKDVPQVYLKSEADKVIAEKDETIDELKERNDELQKATDSAWSKVNAMYDELRHQKYKRCLDKAKLCNERHTFNETNEKRTWLHKWHKRWIAIASKFK